MFLQGRLLPRDFYDLAIASEQEPGSLHSALRAVDTPDLREIQAQLRSLPDRWLANHRQSLIRPVGRHAASNAVRITDEIITDALRFRCRPDRSGPTPPGNAEGTQPMLDVAKIRHFYFHPPPDDPEHESTPEELWAAAERQAVEECLRRAGDPRAEGLGEHGSLIGGPEKPAAASVSIRRNAFPATLCP